MPQLGENASSALASALSSTTLLIMVQLISRLLIFASNQLVLRALSPSTLGIAAQLELYMISILYFSRESIRAAIQRQPVQSISPTSSEHDKSTNSSDEVDTVSKAQSMASQAVVNMSYLSPAMGVPLAVLFGVAYMHFASQEVSQTPYYHASVAVTTIASLMELSIEPFFSVVQQYMLYKKRAAVEVSAAFMKSLAVCGLFIWASQSGRDIGVLPFALGYLSYSLSLICGYFLVMVRNSSDRRFSFLLTRMNSSDSSKYLVDRFSRRLVSLSANVLLQSVIKHLLTQGDSMILAAMTSLEDQGIYSLASNYGGLVARVLFQPIEESSRTIFSSLLNANGTKNQVSKVKAAKVHLNNVMRGYIILSILILPLGPALVPRVLHFLGGRRWTSPDVDGLLALYCYYIPFLAFNGIGEAFVASAASPKELQKQSGWMGMFSACFAIAAYLFLKIRGLGARGLVYANIVNMAVRIVWSFSFIKSYLRRYNSDISLDELNLRPHTYITATTTTILLSGKAAESYGALFPFVIGVIYVISVLFIERKYLVKFYAKIFQFLKTKCVRAKKE